MVLDRCSWHLMASGAAGSRAGRRPWDCCPYSHRGPELASASVEGWHVDRVAASGRAWLVLAVVLTASVTEELLFRAYPIERLARLTGARWPGALVSLAAFVAFHLQGWHLGHVLGVVLPLGAVMTGLYLWRRKVVFVIITHFLLDLPLVLVALGVLPQM
jgi:membrane protease YdiL (CAAX protease family)